MKEQPIMAGEVMETSGNSGGRGMRPVAPLLALALLALVGVGALLAHGGGDGKMGATASGPTATPTENAIAYGETRDYTEAGTYMSLKKLKHDADAVVIGVIAGQAHNGVQSQGGAVAFGYTDWTVQIASVVYDRHHVLVRNGVAVTRTITVRQRGGVINGTRYTSETDPLMHIGERYFFFLYAGAVWSTTPGQSTGIPLEYSTIGDGQGRFLSVGGMLRLNAIGAFGFDPARTEADVSAEVVSLPE